MAPPCIAPPGSMPPAAARGCDTCAMLLLLPTAPGELLGTLAATRGRLATAAGTAATLAAGDTEEPGVGPRYCIGTSSPWLSLLLLPLLLLPLLLLPLLLLPMLLLLLLLSGGGRECCCCRSFTASSVGDSGRILGSLFRGATAGAGGSRSRAGAPSGLWQDGGGV